MALQTTHKPAQHHQDEPSPVLVKFQPSEDFGHIHSNVSVLNMLPVLFSQCEAPEDVPST